jgi:uncharacterized membrane protein
MTPACYANGMELFHSILESLSIPQTRHAAMVHLPIAMSMIGPVVLLALLVKGKNAGSFRWLAVLFFVVATVASLMAERSGHAAADDSTVDRDVTLSEPASDTLSEHREMAERVVWLFAGTTALTMLSALPMKSARVGSTLLALGLSIFTLGWVAGTAHLGGELVYEHGVGVPATENNLPMSDEQEQNSQTMPSTQEQSPDSDPQSSPQPAQSSAPEQPHHDAPKHSTVLKSRRTAPM